MLVLSRRENESVMVGEDIEITVVSVEGDKVKLGIKAPREIQVHRKEVYERIAQENIQAAKISTGAIKALKEKKIGNEDKDHEEDKK